MYHTIQKTIAAWAFNHYIAYYYFDNVNVSQLKVAFEKGEVELEDLPIKRDALRHFKLPMDVTSGVVGKLSIKVPLLTLLTDPWQIKIKNLMLIVAPKKQVNLTNNTNGATDETFATDLSDRSHLDLLRETGDTSLTDQFDCHNTEVEADGIDATTEETKLAEFYASFSSTVSSIVRDIYKNIRLEIEGVTILFEESEHGLVKLDIGSLLLHRPKSARNLVLENVSIYLSNAGVSSLYKVNDLHRIHIGKCNLDIHDEASNNMQLVVVDSEAPNTPSVPKITSETKIEGNLLDCTIDHLTDPSKREGDYLNQSTATFRFDTADDDILLSKRNIFRCDTMKIEFKLNNNIDDKLSELYEKNLHIKLDLIGMQYVHSQRIYELTTSRLMNLLKFYINIQSKRPSDHIQHTNINLDKGASETIRHQDTPNLNKLLNINIEEGLLYVVDDTSGSCAIPILEFSLEDCRVLQFSGKNQQNGFIYGKVGCCYYNREVSTWDTFLDPWPFNLSWELELTKIGHQERKITHRKISLISDELAEFFLTSAFLDISDVALRKVMENFLQPKLWPLARSISPSGMGLAQELNTIFVLNNETGHRIHFAPLEQNNGLFEVNDPNSSPTYGGDSISSSMHKVSINSGSSSCRDSPDLTRVARWISVEAGERLSFGYETVPVYRRYMSSPNTRSRVLLLRVEGWKTLLPIPIDRTGLFFREAWSDRVMNEDTHIVVSIELEEKSARKIISIRSPINLVNQLDSTLEVHFVESNQALYIKPNCHLAVPLPYIYNRMHIRPCNVGVTMSEQPLLWDEIKNIHNHRSKIHICHPITVTDAKHASYCTSQPYRICVAIDRDWPQSEGSDLDIAAYSDLPIYSIKFMSPMTIVNLLPCKIEYTIGAVEATLNMGSQQKVHQVDTTKSTNVHFKMNGFPESKPLTLDPGATGSFLHTLEMFDTRNRSLYLIAEVVLVSVGEEPAVQVVVYAPYWFINKTSLPLIFKQEGAALEAAGQYRDHEDNPSRILLFSFYEPEQEPPLLCSMRMGKSRGTPIWCDGFKLEKGTGERRLCCAPSSRAGDVKANKSLIDINVRKGFGRYSRTVIATFTARYGFDPLTKTPKKATVNSPQNYKLTSYNHNVNLAERIAGQAVSLFSSHSRKATSDIDLRVPGFKLTLLDNSCEKLVEASVEEIVIKCTTKAREQIIDCSVQDIRIDNVMAECDKAIMLDRVINLDESMNIKPAVRLIMDRILGNSFGTTLFKQVQLSMCEFVLNIEERLILKLVEFLNFRNRRQQENMDNLSSDLDKILHPEDDRHSKYYFDLLRIDLSSIKLSVFTSSNLSDNLQRLKSCLGLKFFGFEDAQVQLAPYFQMNISRTFKGVFESVTRFYKRQILEQAPRIVGQQIQNYLRFHLSDLLSTLYDEVYNKLFN